MKQWCGVLNILQVSTFGYSHTRVRVCIRSICVYMVFWIVFVCLGLSLFC